MFLNHLRILGGKELQSDNYRLFDCNTIVKGDKFYLLNTQNKANIFVNKSMLPKKIGLYSETSKVVAAKSTKHLIFDKSDVSYLGKKSQVNNFHYNLLRLKIMALQQKSPVSVGYLPGLVNYRMIFNKNLAEKGKLTFILGKSFFLSNKKSLYLNKKVPYFVFKKYLKFSKMMAHFATLFNGFFLVNKFNLTRKSFLQWLYLPFLLRALGKSVLSLVKLMAMGSFYKRKFDVYTRLINLGALLKQRMKFMFKQLFKFYRPFIFYYSLSKGLSNTKLVPQYNNFIGNRILKYRRSVFVNFSLSKFSFLLNISNSFANYGLGEVVHLLGVISNGLKYFRKLPSKNKFVYFVAAKIYKILCFRFIKRLVISYDSVNNYKKLFCNDLSRLSDKFALRDVLKKKSALAITSFARNFSLDSLRFKKKINKRINKRKVRNFLKVARRFKRIKKIKFKLIAPTLQAMYWFKDVQYKGIIRKLRKVTNPAKIAYIMGPHVEAFRERKAKKKRYLLSKKFKVREMRKQSRYTKVMNFSTEKRDKVYRDRNYKVKAKVFFKNATIR